MDIDDLMFTYSRLKEKVEEIERSSAQEKIAYEQPISDDQKGKIEKELNEKFGHIQTVDIDALLEGK